MDKLSEYIPIVIILVSIVFSIIGKKKKPEKVTQETTLPGKTVGEFIDKMELPRTESNSNQKFTGEKTKKQTVSRAEIITKNKPLPSFSSEIGNLEIEDENVNSSFSFENEEDVRQAIIYAEIINKRDY